MKLAYPTQPPTTKSIIRCGPAGWGGRHWEGSAYPKPLPAGFQPLEFLADRFDTVELSSPFYDFPRAELAAFWARQVSGNALFQFTARLNRQFTHERKMDEADVRAFTEGLQPLLDRGRLGTLLMQFPSSFRFTTENKAFLIQLRRAFHQFPLAAELRHASWNVPEALGTLIDYHVGFVNLDQPQQVRATPPTAHLTHRNAYFKLHGRRTGPGFDAFDDRAQRATGNDYLYSVEELTEWKARIERVARFAESVFVIFNNDEEGRAVVNALQMQGMVSGVAVGTDTAKPTASRPATAAQADLFADRAA